jgi:putative endonuclease
VGQVSPDPGRAPADRRHQLGRLGEQLAAEHLARLGYEILERNYRTRWGELDVVATDGHALVFCEVKSRRASGGHGTALEAVHPLKRKQVRRMGRSWLAAHPERPFTRAIRFDAIGVTFDDAGRLLALAHLEGAF